MKYIYTMPMCGACKSIKAKYDEEGVEYEERSGAILDAKNHTAFDEIDKDAFIQLQMQNQTFPVEVNK